MIRRLGSSSLAEVKQTLSIVLVCFGRREYGGESRRFVLLKDHLFIEDRNRGTKS